ncbi:MAG TPA: hypothetical protein ENN30_02555 [Candidatus Woesearchaeota archaeon]|nr:hypothetical protein [Candidatus Woesearchaeota archaeon]
MFCKEAKKFEDLEGIVLNVNHKIKGYTPRDPVNELYIESEKFSHVDRDYINLCLFTGHISYDSRGYFYIPGFASTHEVVRDASLKFIKDKMDAERPFFSTRELNNRFGKIVLKYFANLAKSGIIEKTGVKSYRVADYEFLENWPYSRADMLDTSQEFSEKYLSVLGLNINNVRKFWEISDIDERVDAAYKPFKIAGIIDFELKDLAMLVMGDDTHLSNRIRGFSKILALNVDRELGLTNLQEYRISKGLCKEHKKNIKTWGDLRNSDYDLKRNLLLPSKEDSLIDYFAGVFIGDGAVLNENNVRVFKMMGRPEDTEFYRTFLPVMLRRLFGYKKPGPNTRNVYGKEYPVYHINSSLICDWIEKCMMDRISELDNKKVFEGIVDTSAVAGANHIMFNSTDYQKLGLIEDAGSEFFDRKNMITLTRKTGNKEYKSKRLVFRNPNEKFLGLEFRNPKTERLLISAGLRQPV